jgi:ketosteroid isomerase-like protein
VAPDLAHSTSEDKLEMLLSDDSPYNAKHVYTLIWKKESTGWKIPHLTNPG